MKKLLDYGLLALVLALAGYGSFVLIAGKINNKPQTQLLGGPTVVAISSGGTSTSTRPTSGQMLIGNSGGLYNFIASSSLGQRDTTTSPAAPNTAIQFNNNGVFGGTSTFTFNNGLLTVNSVTSTNVSSTNSYSNAYTGNWAGNVIPILYGGTNSSTVGSAGCIKYSDGAGLNCTDVGTLGFLLMSADSGRPVFINSTTLPYLSLTYPSSATATFMQIVASTTYNFEDPSVTIQSSSLAIGSTTTIPLGSAVQAQTWLNAACYTDSASATVQFGIHGGALMTALFATSTGTIVPSTTFASNNTFTTGQKIDMLIGNIVNMPNNLSCTIKKQF